MRTPWPGSDAHLSGQQSRSIHDGVVLVLQCSKAVRIRSTHREYFVRLVYTRLVQSFSIVQGLVPLCIYVKSDPTISRIPNAISANCQREESTVHVLTGHCSDKPLVREGLGTVLPYCLILAWPQGCITFSASIGARKEQRTLRCSFDALIHVPPHMPGGTANYSRD